MKRCRNCKLRSAYRARGLCERCYNDLSIRALYPSTSCYARRGVAVGDLGEYALTDDLPEWMRAKLRAVGELLAAGGVSPEPTSAGPGSVQKIAILCVRAQEGLPLFHAEDYSEALFPRSSE